MKKMMTLKKLILNRETLRSLDEEQQKAVRGQGVTNPGDPVNYVTTGPKDSNPNCCA